MLDLPFAGIEYVFAFTRGSSPMKLLKSFTLRNRAPTLVFPGEFRPIAGIHQKQEELK